MTSGGLEEPLSVVFDVNLFVNVYQGEQERVSSGVLSTGDLPKNLYGQCLRIIDYQDGLVRLNLSSHILDNVYEKLVVKYNVPPQFITLYLDYLELLQRNSGGSFVKVPPRKTFDYEVFYDHEDSLIMDLALDTGSRVVVSDDNTFQKASLFRGHTAIISVHNFVKRF